MTFGPAFPSPGLAHSPTGLTTDCHARQPSEKWFVMLALNVTRPCRMALVVCMRMRHAAGAQQAAETIDINQHVIFSRLKLHIDSSSKVECLRAVRHNHRWRLIVRPSVPDRCIGRAVSTSEGG